VTAPETDRIAAAFIARTLPKREWTHEAHLKVGLWHALRHPLAADEDPALDLLRQRIRAYNESTGVPNTETGGYHETITRFYLMLIRRFIASADPSRPIDDLAAELIRRHGDRELPLRHYSRERLFSTAARAGWLPQDAAV
jgi:hypothetical protein